MSITSVIDNLIDPLDYQQYVIYCQQENIYVLNRREYFSALGLYIGAQTNYPELTPEDAYIALLNEEFAVQVLPVQQTEPSFTDMVKAAAGEFTGWVKAGLPRRSGEEVSIALNICRACEFHQDLPGGLLRCDQRKGGCGCMADIKAWMATAHCPKEKW